MGVFICLDGGLSQAQDVQAGLFVCLEAFWAWPACYLKQLGARPRGNAPPPRLSRARLVSATRVLFWSLAGSRSPSHVLQQKFPLLPATRVCLPHNEGRCSLFVFSPLLAPSCSPLSSVQSNPKPSSDGAWWRRGHRRASHGSWWLLLLRLTKARVLLLIVDFFLETSGAAGWWCLFA
jgi:hypothetical protein